MSRYEGPRFHPKVQVPNEIPEGMKLVKFHGHPAFIPKREVGETLIGRSHFTRRQLDALVLLELNRKLSLQIGCGELELTEIELIGNEYTRRPSHNGSCRPLGMSFLREMY